MKEALQISKLAGAKITLIHVYWTGSTHVITDYQQNRFQAMRKKGARILEAGKKKAMAERVPVETLLLTGDPVDQISKTAKEGDFNLVVIGARGLSRMKRLLQGSVSCGVTRNVPSTVLVVR